MITRPSWQDYGTHDDSYYPELWRGCVGAWAPGLGPTGSVLFDLSMRGRNGAFAGTLSPATSWGPGHLNFDYAYSSDAQRVMLDTIGGLRGCSKASILCRVLLQTPAPTNNAAIYMEDTGAAGYTRVGLFQLSTGNVLFIGRDTQTGGSYSVSVSPVTDRWMVICGTYDADGDKVSLYYDSTLVGENTTSIGPLYGSASVRPHVIGAFYDANYNSSVNALLADVRIYDRIVSADELSVYAANPLAPYIPRRRSIHRFYSFAETGNRRRRLLLSSGAYL